MASTFVYDISILMRIDVFTFNQWSIYIINYQISKNKEYDTTQVHNQTKMNDILRYISLNSKNKVQIHSYITLARSKRLNIYESVYSTSICILYSIFVYFNKHFIRW